MAKLLPDNAPLGSAEVDTLWQTATFVFDTNALLHVYKNAKYQETLDILQKLPSRFWLPAQVASEYADNRNKVIKAELQLYDDVITELKKLQNGTNHKKLLFADTKEVLAPVHQAVQAAIDIVAEAKQQRIQSFDFLHASLAELFDEKIGDPYNEERLYRIYEQAEHRFRLLIPPGYEDNKKDGSRKYGDVIVWFQVIDYAQQSQAPIIFVTDDLKSDWWHKDTTPPSPRIELRREIQQKAGVSCHFYSVADFLKDAQLFLSLPVQEAVVEEARNVQEEENLREEEREIISRNDYLQNILQMATRDSHTRQLTEETHRSMANLGANSITAQLDQWARERQELMAKLLANTGANSITAQLDQLSRERQESMAKLLANTGANSITAQLDQLSRERQESMAKLLASTGANSITAQLDQLSRERQESMAKLLASTGANSITAQLDQWARERQELMAKLLPNTGANSITAQLDQLSRERQESIANLTANIDQTQKNLAPQVDKKIRVKKEGQVQSHPTESSNSQLHPSKRSKKKPQ